MKVYILLRNKTFKEVNIGRLENPKLYDHIYYLQNMETKKAASQKYIENPENKKRKQEYNHNRTKYNRSFIGQFGRSYFDDRYNGFPW
jgi:hypothetical protein